MRDLTAAERDVLVVMANDTPRLCVADVLVLAGVDTCAAEAALWALVELDLVCEVTPADDGRHAGAWSWFAITPYGNGSASSSPTGPPPAERALRPLTARGRRHTGVMAIDVKRPERSTA